MTLIELMNTDKCKYSAPEVRSLNLSKGNRKGRKVGAKSADDLRIKKLLTRVFLLPLACNLHSPSGDRRCSSSPVVLSSRIFYVGFMK